MDTTIKLTPEQVAKFNEIMLNELSAKKSFEVAFEVHINYMNESERRKKAWWTELQEQHGFAPDAQWTYKGGTDFIQMVDCSDV